MDTIESVVQQLMVRQRVKLKSLEESNCDVPINRNNNKLALNTMMAVGSMSSTANSVNANAIINVPATAQTTNKCPVLDTHSNQHKVPLIPLLSTLSNSQNMCNVKKIVSVVSKREDTNDADDTPSTSTTTNSSDGTKMFKNSNPVSSNQNVLFFKNYISL